VISRLLRNASVSLYFPYLQQMPKISCFQVFVDEAEFCYAVTVIQVNGEFLVWFFSPSQYSPSPDELVS
jgi:hypothetical protein